MSIATHDVGRTAECAAHIVSRADTTISVVDRALGQPNALSFQGVSGSLRDGRFFDFYLQLGAVAWRMRGLLGWGIAPRDFRSFTGKPGSRCRWAVASDPESWTSYCCNELPTQTNHSRCADGIEVGTFSGWFWFASRVLMRLGSDCRDDGYCKRNDPGGVSRFRLPCGRYAEAPAADLVTARVVSRTPEIPPERRRDADFSGTLH